VAKYDWKQLEEEYILSDYKSVKAFLRDKNIKSTGNTNKQTKGWTEKKAIKKKQKSIKTIEKVIERQSEKEAEQIVNIRTIANELALNIIQANKENNLYIDENGKKQKGLIDKKGLKQLTSALKDLNDILSDNKEKENQEELDKLDEVLKNIGGII